MKAQLAELKIEGHEPIFLPLVHGTEGDVAIDVSELYRKWKVLTCDPGYLSTGSCYSAISFIDGEKGILRYRGYNVYDLAQKSKLRGNRLASHQWRSPH